MSFKLFWAVWHQICEDRSKTLRLVHNSKFSTLCQNVFLKIYVGGTTVNGSWGCFVWKNPKTWWNKDPKRIDQRILYYRATIRLIRPSLITIQCPIIQRRNTLESVYKCGVSMINALYISPQILKEPSI